MRRYSEAVKADVRRRMSPPMRQSVARISEELGIHMITLYNWRKAWRLQGEVVPASEKDLDGWSAADKFTVVLENAGLNATELSAYCRERGGLPDAVRATPRATQARRPLTPHHPTAAQLALPLKFALQPGSYPHGGGAPEFVHLLGEVGSQQG